MNIFQCFLTSPPQAWNTQKCKTLPFQNPRHDPPISWIISSTRITAKLPHRPTIENEFHLMLKWSEINPRWHIFDKHMQYHAAEAHIDRNKAATKCRSLGKRRVSEQYSWVSLCCKSLPFFVQNSKNSFDILWSNYSRWLRGYIQDNAGRGGASPILSAQASKLVCPENHPRWHKQVLCM